MGTFTRRSFSETSIAGTASSRAFSVLAETSVPTSRSFAPEAGRIESAEQVPVLNEARKASGWERLEDCAGHWQQRMRIASERNAQDQPEKTGRVGSGDRDCDRAGERLSEDKKGSF